MLDFLFDKKDFKNISPKEAKELLSSGRKTILLDVRTREEYREVHIPNSISLPLAQLKSEIGKVAGDKNAEMIVYCLSGARSAVACRQLAAMGYTGVSNMGGISSWHYETERGK